MSKLGLSLFKIESYKETRVTSSAGTAQAQGTVRRKKITHLKNAVSCLPYYRVGE
jgi:hypothetical protein